MAECDTVERRQIEGQMAKLRARGVYQVQDRDQHQDRAEHRVQDELEGGVIFAPVPPDSDQEVHRDQHQLPEHVKQKQIDRQQRAQQAHLEHQHEKTELARPGLDIAAARIKHREREQHRRQQHQEQADPVHPEVIRDAELRNPRGLLDELVAGRGRVEGREEINRNRERDQREDKPDRQAARASGCASTNSAPNSGVKTSAVSQ